MEWDTPSHIWPLTLRWQIRKITCNEQTGSSVTEAPVQVTALSDSLAGSISVRSGKLPARLVSFGVSKRERKRKRQSVFGTACSSVYPSEGLGPVYTDKQQSFTPTHTHTHADLREQEVGRVGCKFGEGGWVCGAISVDLDSSCPGLEWNQLISACCYIRFGSKGSFYRKSVFAYPYMSYYDYLRDVLGHINNVTLMGTEHSCGMAQYKSIQI